MYHKLTNNSTATQGPRGFKNMVQVHHQNKMGEGAQWKMPLVSERRVPRGWARAHPRYNCHPVQMLLIGNEAMFIDQPGDLIHNTLDNYAQKWVLRY